MSLSVSRARVVIVATAVVERLNLQREAYRYELFAETGIHVWRALENRAFRRNGTHAGHRLKVETFFAETEETSDK